MKFIVNLAFCYSFYCAILILWDLIKVIGGIFLLLVGYTWLGLCNLYTVYRKLLRKSRR